MKNLLAILTLLTALLFSSVSPLFSQNFQKLYQEALIKEEGEGQLLEAIDLYNQIVEDKNADVLLQAKALLHVGFCYEKLGKDEATKAYQRLVNNFPGQKNEVAVARERLSRLIVYNQKTAEETERLKNTLTNKKIWDESDTDLEGAVSPDGRYLSYVDWDTGDLALYEIATEKKRRLTNKGSWEKSQSYCEYSRWFHDSKRIIYLWYNEEEGNAELRTITIDNPEPETLIKDKEMEWAEIYDCSSDGKYVLACLDRKSDEGILTLISLNDGSERALRPHYSNAVFSNDQRYVIYDLPQEDDKGNKDIYIMELDTKNETKLIENPGDDRLVGRVPNGNDILFISDRTGTPDFWSISVQNGKSLGEAQLVKSNRGPFPPISLGFTNSGAFYYGQRRNNINVYETEIDPVTGEIITAPARIIQSYIGANACPDYSPDGKYLAYVSRRPPGTMRFTTNPVGNVLRICSLETKEEKEFRPDINVFGWPRWSPDGNSVMVISFDINGNLGYYQIDIRSGITNPFLITNARNLFGGHGWLPDGNTFFYGLRDSITREYQLILRNIKSGEKQVVFQSRNQFGISASRDGSIFSLLSNNDKSLKILPVSGGEGKELFNSEEMKNSEFEIRGSCMAWSSDGKHIYFSMINSNNNSPELEMCRISVVNGKIDKLGIKTNSHFANLNAHPDGKHFSYSSRDKMNSEVWELDNFLPFEKLAQKNVTEATPKTLTSEKVWVGPDANNSGTPSPDGKFLTYLDYKTGNVGIREFPNGETHLLTKEGTWKYPIQFTIGSAVSPNNKQVTYSWYNRKANYEIRITDVNNHQAKVLYGNKDEDVYPCAWSPDGKIIYARSYLNKTRQTRILAITVSNGDIQVLKTFNFFYWMNICASPDNKFIAYDLPSEKDNGNFNIHLISLDDKNEVSLVDHPANDRILGWFPNENKILFKSDRSGTWDAWIVSVSNGKAAGKSQRVMTDLGQVSPMGFTNNETYYYSIFSRNFSAFSAPFDSVNLELKIESGKPILGSIRSLEWSPDGEYLTYIKELTGPSGPGWYNRPLYILNRKSGEERKLRDFSKADSPRWSPDGKTILTLAVDKEKELNTGYYGGVYTINVESGEISEHLLASSRDNWAAVEWAADQKSFYILNNDRLVIREIATGQEEILLRNQKFNKTLARSPDNKNLLFCSENQLYIVPTTGGNASKLFTVENVIDKADYSPDGNYIFFTERMDDGYGSVLWRLSADGKNPKKLWQSKKPIAGFSIHPEGQKIVLSTYNQETEIWRLNNLLSNE